MKHYKSPKVTKSNLPSMIKWLGAKNVKDIISATLKQRARGWEDPKITRLEYIKSLRIKLIKAKIAFLTEEFANLNYEDADMSIKVKVITSEIKKLQKQITRSARL
jgi:hypothetical protein